MDNLINTLITGSLVEYRMKQQLEYFRRNEKQLRDEFWARKQAESGK